MIVLFLSLIGMAAVQALSLGQVQGYSSLREYALDCYEFLAEPAGYLLASKLSCQPYNAPGNACFCRPDLQPDGVNYISSCAAPSCLQNDLNISSATQTYKDYCTSARYTAKAANVPAQTTGVTLATTTSPSRPLFGAPTATSTFISDPGTSNPASSSPTSDLSLSA